MALRFFLAAIVASCLFGCASDQIPQGCAIDFPMTSTWLAPTGAPSGKRVYLYPGLNSSQSLWDSGPFLVLVNDLRSDGDDVVLMLEPTTVACFFADGGAEYRTRFVAALEGAMDLMDASHGRAKNIIGGISFGGLHAMIGAASLKRFESWFAHVPVTRIDQLAEFAKVGAVPYFDPFDEVSTLRDSTGMITWGTADLRTNWVLTKKLAGMLGRHVVKVAYPGEDHTTTNQNVADIAAWVAAR